MAFSTKTEKVSRFAELLPKRRVNLGRVIRRLNKHFEIDRRRKAGLSKPVGRPKKNPLPPPKVPFYKTQGPAAAHAKDIEFSSKHVEASICRASFFEFVLAFWEFVSAEEPVWNWHIEVLCDELQEMAERVFNKEDKLHDLVVNISPGTTKSTIMSVMFPAWCWTRMPSFQFIGVSYSDKLAMDLSVKCRDVVRSEKYKEYFPYITWRDDQDAKGFFKNTSGGWRFCAGVNGTVTGYHAHFIVIDDPLNPKEAVSEVELAAANRWIVETLSSRKVNKSVTPMALVMQRLHQDDPTAHFLRKKNVKHYCLPAELTEDVKPLELRNKYSSDGLMDPIRMKQSVLAEEKAKGEFFYASQFLQRPVPRGGGMFKTNRIKTGIPPQRFTLLCRYWDKAGTLGGKGSFTVGVLMGRTDDGEFWVLDVIRVRLDSAEREKLIHKTALEDGYDVIVGVEQEPGSGGKGSAEDTARRLAGFRVRIVKVDKTTGGKEWRADPWSVQMNAGNAYIPFTMRKGDLWDGWAHEFVQEHHYFPNSTWKDQVDAAAGAFMIVKDGTLTCGAVQ